MTKFKSAAVLPILYLMTAFGVVAILTFKSGLVTSGYHLIVCTVAGLAAVFLLRLVDPLLDQARTPKLIVNIDQLVARGSAQMSNPVMLCNPKGNIIWANGAFGKMTGYSLDDAIGAHPGKLLQGDETDTRTVAEITDQISKGEPFSGDILNYRKDGSTFWIHLEIEQIRNSSGQIEALFGCHRDITELKQHEAMQKQQLAAALAAADVDPLTGLLNHRAFHNRLRSHSSEAKLAGDRLGVLLIDLDNFRFFNDSYGHIVGDNVLRQVAETLMSAGVGLGFEDVSRYGGDEFAMLIPGIRTIDQEVSSKEIESIFELLGYRLQGHSRPIPIRVSVGAAYYPDDGDNISDVLELANSRLLLAKVGADDAVVANELRELFRRNADGFTMLDALVTAVDNKDRYTRRHSEDVLNHVMAISSTMELEQSERDILYAAALLHDVGKIGVPDRILRKPGALTDDEFEAVKKHPQMGAAIVCAVPGFEQTLDAIRLHHERWDGKGYPFGLVGEEIPLSARILAVADGFSAMTADRPYRQGTSANEAYSVLLNGAGSQWDPKIVEIFVHYKRSQTD